MPQVKPIKDSHHFLFPKHLLFPAFPLLFPGCNRGNLQYRSSSYHPSKKSFRQIYIQPVMSERTCVWQIIPYAPGRPGKSRFPPFCLHYASRVTLFFLTPSSRSLPKLPQLYPATVGFHSSMIPPSSLHCYHRAATWPNQEPCLLLSTAVQQLQAPIESIGCYDL
jgi:hypothetical protein